MSANAQMTARGDAMYYVHSFLCLLIMFGFGQLPPVEPLTALGMRLIGIFLFFAGTVVFELLGSCFVIPIAEELLFRGVVYMFWQSSVP